MKLDPSILDLSIPELLDRVDLEKRHGQSYKGKENCQIQMSACEPPIF